MLYPCSSRWGPPARRHQSPGSLLPAPGVENLPGLAESHLHDRAALVCVGRRKGKREGRLEREEIEKTRQECKTPGVAVGQGVRVWSSRKRQHERESGVKAFYQKS